MVFKRLGKLFLDTLRLQGRDTGTNGSNLGGDYEIKVENDGNLHIKKSFLEDQKKKYNDVMIIADDQSEGAVYESESNKPTTVTYNVPAVFNAGDHTLHKLYEKYKYAHVSLRYTTRVKYTDYLNNINNNITVNGSDYSYEGTDNGSTQEGNVAMQQINFTGNFIKLNDSYDNEGYILTTSHFVTQTLNTEGGTDLNLFHSSIYATYLKKANGEEDNDKYEMISSNNIKLIYYDPVLDISLFKVDDDKIPKEQPMFELEDKEENIKIGEKIFTIGENTDSAGYIENWGMIHHPWQIEQGIISDTVTYNGISHIPSSLRITGSITPGQSGGIVFNSSGKGVGLVSHSILTGTLPESSGTVANDLNKTWIVEKTSNGTEGSITQTFNSFSIDTSLISCSISLSNLQDTSRIMNIKISIGAGNIFTELDYTNDIEFSENEIQHIVFRDINSKDVNNEESIDISTNQIVKVEITDYDADTNLSGIVANITLRLEQKDTINFSEYQTVEFATSSKNIFKALKYINNNDEHDINDGLTLPFKPDNNLELFSDKLYQYKFLGFTMNGKILPSIYDCLKNEKFAEDANIEDVDKDALTELFESNKLQIGAPTFFNYNYIGDEQNIIYFSDDFDNNTPDNNAQVSNIIVGIYENDGNNGEKFISTGVLPGQNEFIDKVMYSNKEHIKLLALHCITNFEMTQIRELKIKEISLPLNKVQMDHNSGDTPLNTNYYSSIYSIYKSAPRTHFRVPNGYTSICTSFFNKELLTKEDLKLMNVMKKKIEKVDSKSVTLYHNFFGGDFTNTVKKYMIDPDFKWEKYVGMVKDACNDIKTGNWRKAARTYLKMVCEIAELYDSDKLNNFNNVARIIMADIENYPFDTSKRKLL